MKTKDYKYTINGTKFTVKIGDVEDNMVHVEVNGVPYNVELDKAPAGKKTVAAPVKAPQRAPRTETGEKVIAKPAMESQGGYTVTAPLPGTVTSFSVKEGDVVEAGATVCILEAMKMENDIHAAQGGKVVKIVASVGDALPQDGAIMVIE